jgi:hypothetical protein
MGLPPLQPRIPQCPSVTCGMRLKAGRGARTLRIYHEAPFPRTQCTNPNLDPYIEQRYSAVGNSLALVVPVTQLPVSWHPRGFEAPPAHSRCLSHLIPPQFPAEIVVKARIFPVGVHPSSQSIARKPPCAMQGGVFQCGPWGEPFKEICAPTFERCRVTVPCCDGLLMALTQASNECKIWSNPPPLDGYWAPWGPGFPKIELEENTKISGNCQNSRREGRFDQILHSPLCLWPPLVGGLTKTKKSSTWWWTRGSKPYIGCASPGH